MNNRTRGGRLGESFDCCLREAAISEVSRLRMAPTVDRAVEFFGRLGIQHLSDVTPADVCAFVTARLVNPDLSVATVV